MRAFDEPSSASFLRRAFREEMIAISAMAKTREQFRRVRRSAHLQDQVLVLQRADQHREQAEDRNQGAPTLAELFHSSISTLAPGRSTGAESRVPVPRVQGIHNF